MRWRCAVRITLRLCWVRVGVPKCWGRFGIVGYIWGMAERLGIYGFIRLSMNERAQVTWDSGTFLLSRSGGEAVTVNLHAVEDFYVEVTYSNEHNTIADVTPFNAPHLLEPYLEQINLSDLSDQ